MTSVDRHDRRRQWLSSASLSLLGGLIAMVADYGLNRMLGLRTTLVETFVISQSIGFPLIFMLTGQKMAATAAHDALKRSQEARQVLVDQLKDALAAAQSANAAKSALVANVSHEIRTPLNGVLGMSEIMAMNPLPPEQQKRLSVILQSSRCMLTILNDLLDYSKIEAGKLSLEYISFDLDEIMAGVHAAFSELAEQKGIQLRIESDTVDLRYGDPTRVRQILDNLVSNALKFTTHGEIGIRAVGSDSGIKLIVSDTGQGIAPEVAAGLFSPFTQAGADISRRFGGTGLGLSICRDLAGLMNGSISVESRLGEGSVFTVDLPLAISDVPPPEKLRSTIVELSGLRVLVADDNATNRLVAQAILEAFGIAPVLAQDGAQAVDLWREQPFDLILMDMQMPILDGLAATRQIRQLETQEGRDPVTILALSADVMAHQIAAYYDAGMNGHIPKPIEPRRLGDALASAFPCRFIDASTKADA